MPQAPSIEIRTIKLDDKDAWRNLYNGYANFYKREMTDKVADNVWSWLHNPDHELNCIVAAKDGKLIGLAHYRQMLRPLHGVYIGYLDDLFVAPEARGLKTGEALFTELGNISKLNGWGVMRWLTADDNYRARSLYDKLASKSGFNLYEMKSEN